MTPVDRLYTEFNELVNYLISEEQTSSLIVVEENFKKVILLAAASYFETQIINSIIKFIEAKSANNKLTSEFVKRKALSRQYHTLFDWDEGNANRFYGFFGSEFKDFMRAKLKSNQNLDESVKAFIELGASRNRLVHQDFGNFTLEKTAKEIFELYQTANLFVNDLEGLMHECPDSVT